MKYISSLTHGFNVKLCFATVLVASFATLLSSSTLAELNPITAINTCAVPAIQEKVNKFYLGKGKGAPLMIAGRALKLPEALIASALQPEQHIGVKADAKRIKDIWTTIDQWGEETNVRLVFTMGGSHVFDFPSNVPIRQEDLDDGWLDIFADQGDGVRGHLWLDQIKTVYAINLPGSDGTPTRAISFYAADGSLIIGVYASISTKSYDKAVEPGFEKTWALLKTLPKACG